MKIDKEKILIFLRRIYPKVLLSLLFFVAGGLISYYFNPKCGTLADKTDFLVTGLQNLFSDKQKIEIVEVEQECECPECIEEPVEIEEDTCPIRVDISGAVNDPGVYCFRQGSVIMDAVEKADGFRTEYGDKYISRKINLAQELENNQKIYFPFTDDLICELQSFSPEVEELDLVNNSSESEEEDSSGEENENNKEEDSSSCISINNASKEELMELTGIGESTAEKIIEGRPYEKIDDLLEVKGIGEATLEKIIDDICL